MKYLATIKFGSDSSSQSFESLHAAEKWLDTQNNNLEHTTIIYEMDDKWNIVNSFYHTEGAE